MRALAESRKNKAPSLPQPSEGHVGGGSESGFVIEDLLELGHCLRALFGPEMGETAQISRFAIRDVAALIGLGGAQLLDGLGAIAMLQLDPGANLRN
jgi:hypothetical protein